MSTVNAARSIGKFSPGLMVFLVSSVTSVTQTTIIERVGANAAQSQS